MVRFLVWEDPTCRRAAKPMHHNYWACALEPGGHNYWAHMLQLLKPTCPRAHALQKGRLPHWEACALQVEHSPQSPQLQDSPRSSEDPVQPKIKQTNKTHLFIIPWFLWIQSSCGLAGPFSPGPHQAAIQGSASAAISSETPLRKDAFPSFEAVGMRSLLASWLSVGMALGSQRPPIIPYHAVFSINPLTTWRLLSFRASHGQSLSPQRQSYIM